MLDDLLTLDDVALLADEDPDHRYELREGMLLVVPQPTWRHQQITAELATWLTTHGYQNRVNTGVGVRTSADNLNGRVPDVVVIVGPVPDDTVWLDPYGVLLAVEVVSPDSAATDHHLKPVEYAAAGIRHLWHVDPDETVVQFRLTGDRYVKHTAVPLQDLLAGDAPTL